MQEGLALIDLFVFIVSQKLLREANQAAVLRELERKTVLRKKVSSKLSHYSAICVVHSVYQSASNKQSDILPRILLTRLSTFL